MNNNNNIYCRVCGLDNLEPIWSEDGQTPSYGHCVCCGIRFGTDDVTAAGAKAWRKFWIEQGCKWDEPDAKPANWSLEEQLKNIPDPKNIAWITGLNTFCRICGWDELVPPWGIDGKCPSYNMCDCCGGEFGHDDDTIDNIREYRQKWIDNGCKWNGLYERPVNWSLEEQMKNIPEEYV